ncbi:MAG: S1 RNA-binding domain-containing protein [Clostridiales bacterium]|nr:S1 RNA-binding domain-containing protein [Clostridiales bacterium]
MTITVGSIVDGVVTGITKFGAFVEIEGGVTGLVHISEVANAYVKEVSDCLQVQDIVRVKVINIGENGKVGLSVKQAAEKPLPSQPRDGLGFEDKLAKFMKESNEKLVTLKRHQEGKKGR